MSLRVGAACAVVDDEGRVLLSRRRDFNFWNLPAGRRDPGETLRETAAREVREETGVIAHVERAVGLYFWEGFAQVTVLFAGWPVGGALRRESAEARENRYFAPAELPDFPRRVMTLDALGGGRPEPRVLPMTPAEQLRLKLALRRRWLGNTLRGRREPPFAPAEVQAVAVVWDDRHARVLTVPRKRTEALPRVICGGRRAPWDELAALVATLTERHAVALRWVGLWEDRSTGALELVFAATFGESLAADGAAAWSLASAAALPSREAQYVGRVRRTFAADAVWMIGRDPVVRAGDTLLWNKESGAWS